MSLSFFLQVCRGRQGVPAHSSSVAWLCPTHPVPPSHLFFFYILLLSPLPSSSKGGTWADPQLVQARIWSSSWMHCPPSLFPVDLNPIFPYRGKVSQCQPAVLWFFHPFCSEVVQGLKVPSQPPPPGKTGAAAPPVSDGLWSVAKVCISVCSTSFVPYCEFVGL